MVYVRVDNASLTSDQMSETLKTMLNQQGVAASWMIYGNTMKNGVTFTVQWRSFQ